MPTNITWEIWLKGLEANANKSPNMVPLYQKAMALLKSISEYNSGLEQIAKENSGTEITDWSK